MSNKSIFVVIAAACLMVAALVIIATKPAGTFTQSEFDQDPGYENSTYVGHFTEGTELRRIDDVEKGVVCYKVTRDKAISCVFTGEFGDGVINQQE